MREAYHGVDDTGMIYNDYISDNGQLLISRIDNEMYRTLQLMNTFGIAYTCFNQHTENMDLGDIGLLSLFEPLRMRVMILSLEYFRSLGYFSRSPCNHSHMFNQNQFLINPGIPKMEPRYYD